VRSSTLVSRLCVKLLISASAVRRRSRITSKERASSSSSSLLPAISSGLSSSIWLIALVPSISFSIGWPTNRRVKKMMNRPMSVTSTPVTSSTRYFMPATS
jgi:hypothetical protein